MISLYTQYSSQATTPDADYPNGTFKNQSGGGTVRGTPLEQTWARDIDGGRQAAIRDAGLPLNDIPDTRLVSQYQQALDFRYNRNTQNPSLTIQQVCGEKYWDTYNWTKPDAFPNYLYDAGYTTRDACVGIDYDTYRPCLFVVRSDNTIRKVTGSWVYTASPVIGSALSLNFGETPESIRSICSDGGKIYVLWRASDNTYRVSSFDMVVFGRYLNITLGVDYAYQAEYSKIILANDNYLAISLDSVSGNSGVAIVHKDTGALTIGNGASQASSNPFPGCGRMTTDGTHVFWIHTEDALPSSCSSYLCSAKISSPSTSDYTSTLVGVPSPSIIGIPTALYNFGGADGTVVTATTSGFFWIFSKTLDAARAAFEIHNNIVYATASEARTVLGCDGTNLWIQLQQEDDADTDSRLAFGKVPLTICIKSNAVTSPSNAAQYEGSFVMTDKAGVGITDYEPGRLLYDGLDMWYVLRNGQYYRIANPGLR